MPEANASVQLFLIVMFVPETYHPVLLRRKAMQLRKETGNQEWIAPIEKLDRSITKTVLWSCIRPFQLLFFEPMVRVCVQGGNDWWTDCCVTVPEPLHLVCDSFGDSLSVLRRISTRL